MDVLLFTARFFFRPFFPTGTDFFSAFFLDLFGLTSAGSSSTYIESSASLGSGGSSSSELSTTLGLNFGIGLVGAATAAFVTLSTSSRIMIQQFVLGIVRRRLPSSMSIMARTLRPSSSTSVLCALALPFPFRGLGSSDSSSSETITLPLSLAPLRGSGEGGLTDCSESDNSMTLVFRFTPLCKLR